MLAQRLSVMVCSLGLLLAEDARALTLREALARVYQESPRLAAAQARLRAVDEGVPLALAGGRPQVTVLSSAGLAQTRSDGDTRMLATARQALVVSQPVYTGGAVAADTERATNEARAERARLRRSEQDVLLEAVDAYTAVMRDQAILELATRNERRLTEQLAATRDRNRFGAVTLTDVAQAETRLARAAADRASAQADLAVSTARFQRVIGLPPDQLVAAEPLLDEAAAPDLGTVDEVPEVEAASFALASARADVELAKARLRPRLSIDGGISYDHEPDTLIDQESSLRIGASLVIPLFQGGGEHARVRQSRQTALERRNALADARRRAEEEIAAARAELRRATARIGALEVQADRASFALEGVRQEALVGARSVLDVLDAEQELFAAEVELTIARRDEVLASYRLAAAAGRLDSVSLGLAVEPYDAEAHLREVRDKWFGLGDDAQP
jgi:TolC family type I secretion outer membrane protein